MAAEAQAANEGLTGSMRVVRVDRSLSVSASEQSRAAVPRSEEESSNGGRPGSVPGEGEVA